MYYHNKHGFLFVAVRPWDLAKRVEPEDRVHMFEAATRCLTFAHIVRGDRKWMQSYARTVGQRPCSRSVARWRNEAQCDWTEATHSNYAWMALTARALQQTAALAKSAKRMVDWFMDNVPMAAPDKVVPPTPFPLPRGCPETEASLKLRARAALAFYREEVRRRGDR